MEEADYLADQIGIMVNGSLQVVGTSLELKQQFGDEYKIQLICSPDKSQTLSELVEQYLPGFLLFLFSLSFFDEILIKKERGNTSCC